MVRYSMTPFKHGLLITCSGTAPRFALVLPLLCLVACLTHHQCLEALSHSTEPLTELCCTGLTCAWTCGDQEPEHIALVLPSMLSGMLLIGNVTSYSQSS